MKTLSMYLRAAKVEAEDAGESTEGMAESVSKLRGSILALTKGKVDIMLDENTFKGMYQVYSELSKVYGSLSDVDQAALLELLGGKRNANVTAALLENWDIAERALAESMGAAGSAIQENEKVLDSIQGRLNILKATAEEFASNILDSSTVKFVVSTGTVIVGLLNKVTAAFNGIVPKFLIALTLVTKLSSIISSLRSGSGILASIFGEKVGGMLSTTALASGLSGITSGLKGVARAFKNTRASGYSFGRSIAAAGGELMSMIGVAGAATIAITGIMMAFQAVDNAQQKREQAASESLDRANSAAADAEKVLEAYNAYQAASTGYDKGTVSKEALTEATYALAEALGLEKSAVDSLNESYSNGEQPDYHQMALDKFAEAEDAAYQAMLDAEAAASGVFSNWVGIKGMFSEVVDSTVGNIVGADLESETYKLIEFIDAMRNSGIELVQTQEEIDAGTISVTNLLKIYEEMQRVLENMGADSIEYGGYKFSRSDINAAMSVISSVVDNVKNARTAYEDAVAARMDFEFGTSISEIIEEQIKSIDPRDINDIITLRNNIFKNAQDLLSGREFSEEEARWIAQNFDSYLEQAISSALSSNGMLSDLYQQYTEMAHQTALVDDARKTIVDAFAEYGITESKLQEYNIRYGELLDKYSNMGLSNLEISNSEDFRREIAELQKELGITTDLYVSYYEILQSLSDEELVLVADAIKAGSSPDEALKDLNSGLLEARNNAEEAKTSLSDLWESEEFSSARKELEDLGKSGDITASKILELAKSNETLRSIMDETGISAEYLASIFSDQIQNGNGIANITEQFVLLDQAINGAKNRYIELDEARARYVANQSAETNDQAYKDIAQAVNAAMEDINKGKVNSNQVWNSAELLLGKDTIEELGYDEGAIAAEVQKWSQAFADADDSGAGLVTTIENMYNASDAVGEALRGLMTITRDENGMLNFDIPAENIAEIADNLNLSESTLLAMLKALNDYGYISWAEDAEKVLSALSENGAVQNIEATNKVLVNEDLALEQLTKVTGNLGSAHDELNSVLEKTGAVSISANDGAEELRSSLVALGIAAEDASSGLTSIDISQFTQTLLSAGFTFDQISAIVSKLLEIDEIKLNIGEEGAIDSVEDFKKWFDDQEWVINPDIKFSDKTKSVFESSFAGMKQSFNDLFGGSGAPKPTDGVEKVPAVSRKVLSSYSTLNASLNNAATSAGNLSSRLHNLPSSKTIRVDLQINGEARLNNLLNKSNTSRKSIWPFPGMASGTRGASRGKHLTGELGPELVWSKDRAYLTGIGGPNVVDLNEGDVVYNAEETKKIMRGKRLQMLKGSLAHSTGGGINLPSNPSQGSSGSVTVNTKVTAGVSEALEEQLKALKEEIDDILSQYEFDIFMAEKNKKSAEEIIAIYKKMQETVHAQAAKYRSMGVDENSQYIRDLKKQWWEYEEAIRDARKKQFDDWVKDAKFSIEAMEHNDDGVDKMLDSWRVILESINSEIEYYTSQGYDIASDEIQDLMQEMWDAEQEIEDLLDSVLDKINDSIDEIQNVFKTLRQAASEYQETGFITIDTLQDIIGLGVEYMSYLRDENGFLVINRERIEKVLAAKTQQLAIEAALNYVRRIGLALSNNEVEELNRLLYATEETTNATWGLVYANLAFLDLTDEQRKKAKRNIDSLRAIADNVSANISRSLSADDATDSYGDLKDAMGDIIELTKDMIRHEHDEMVDALNDQLDKYKEIIDKKRESLELTKSEIEYNKDIQDKTKEIAALQARIDALALDDSRAAQIERGKLMEELAEKQEKLEETQRDHAYDLQKESLDKQEEAFEDIIKARQEEIENEISSEEKLYRLAIQRISEEWETLEDQLLSWNTEYGNSLNKDVIAQWEAALLAVEQYGDILKAIEASGKSPDKDAHDISDIVVDDKRYDDGDRINQISAQMRQNSLAWFTASGAERSRLESENARLSSELESYVGRGVYRSGGAWYREDGSLLYQLSKDDIARSIVAQMKANSAAWFGADQQQREALANENIRLASVLSSALGVAITRDANGRWLINGKPLYDVYHSGGVVGGGSNRKRERFALLQDDEWVLSSKQIDAVEKLLTIGQMLSEHASSLSSSALDSLNRLRTPGGGLRAPNTDFISDGATIIQVDASLSVSGVNDEEILQAIKRHPRMVAEQVSRVLA